MIVITSLSTVSRSVYAGDSFVFTITDGMNCEVVISEDITVSKEINYMASFRFALEDGTCPGFHLSGIFANKGELPIEMQNGIMFEDLTQEQRVNFVNSVGINMETRQAKKSDDDIVKLEFDFSPIYNKKLTQIKNDYDLKDKSFFQKALEKINNWAKK